MRPRGLANSWLSPAPSANSRAPFQRASMVSHYLRLDIRRTDAKMPAEMNAKSQAVEECARTQYAIVTSGLARDVGERIGWIGDGDQHRLRCSPHDLGHDLSVDGSVGCAPTHGVVFTEDVVK